MEMVFRERNKDGVIFRKFPVYGPNSLRSRQLFVAILLGSLLLVGTIL